MKILVLVMLVLLVPSVSFGCRSDVDCDIGQRCVKSSMQDEGRCMSANDLIRDNRSTTNPVDVQPARPPRGPLSCPPGYIYDWNIQTCTR